MCQTFDDLDVLRREQGISWERLSVAAGLSRTWVNKHRSGEVTEKSHLILKRLKRALSRLSGNPEQLANGGRDVLPVYLAICALVSRDLKVSMEIIRANPPSMKASGNPDWMAAAKVREITIYLVNTAIGLKQVQIARALGVTQAAISQTCRKIEDTRDEDNTLESLLVRLEAELEL
ncbi:MAG: hypothetical protein AAF478_03575 [Pseudomonadota bacterium]